MNDMNRPYTLAELRELPEGSRVWVESRQRRRSKCAGWAWKDIDRFVTSEVVWPIDNIGVVATYRAWPAPPTEDEMAAWPWEEDGHARED